MVFDDLTADNCYQVMTERDLRFDGHFFVGVRSTRIYCRPICRIRLPNRGNCSFHRNAAAAEVAGFRPCLRCRPELAPGVVAIEWGQRVAAIAAQLINFSHEFGVSPERFAETQRLLLAKRLLTDTRLPLAVVAASSGFSSVRRMNSVFNARYRFSPSRLRLVARPGIGNGTGQETGCAASLTFVLPYRPPYDFDGLLKFLRDRAIPGVESVDETGYRRILRVTKVENGKAVETLEKIGWVEVTHRSARHALELRCDDVFSSEVRLVLARTKQAFDLDADPAEIDRVLGALATNTPGVHLPGTFDPFELAIRAILGQQVTVKAARTLVTRFVAALGTPISTPFVDLNRAFPSVHHIAGLDPAVIASLGIVRQRAEAIISLANAIGSGAIELAPTAEPTQTIELLCGIRGIGPWTAHYIAMRALAWRDAWLPGDVALQNALGLPNTARGIRAAHDQANEWRPWRSYAVLQLWLRGSIAQAPSAA